MQSRIDDWFASLGRLAVTAEVTDARGQAVPLAAFVTAAVSRFRATHAAGNRIMFVGNGGSAAIASHMAIDFSKNGGMRATAFSDAAALTCLGNDLGFDQVYAKQIELHARAGDLLVAISSSGRSANIVNAVDAARNARCAVVTFSGFDAGNTLRTLGDHNVYVASHAYGLVEVAHLALCHSILDIACGFGAEGAENPVAAQQRRLTA